MIAARIIRWTETLAYRGQAVKEQMVNLDFWITEKMRLFHLYHSCGILAPKPIQPLLSGEFFRASPIDLVF